jgi:hypothetical protein
MFTQGNKQGKGRPKGSNNKFSEELKEVINQLATDLYQSINVSELKASEKAKLFIGILPYLIAKKSEVSANITSTDMSWLDSYSEQELELILNNK